MRAFLSKVTFHEGVNVTPSIKESSPDIELRVSSYGGRKHNPIKGQKNSGESDFDAASREFHEETGLTLIFGLKENEPWDEHDGFEYSFIVQISILLDCQ